MEPDGLRTVTLLARDVASLATALCAPAADMGAAWAALAAAHQDGFDGTTEQGGWRGYLGVCLAAAAAAAAAAATAAQGRSMPHQHTFARPAPRARPRPAALEVVKGAVAADSACLQRITKTAAKADYRLSDKDLEVGG